MKSERKETARYLPTTAKKGLEEKNAHSRKYEIMDCWKDRQIQSRLSELFISWQNDEKLTAGLRQAFYHDKYSLFLLTNSDILNFVDLAIVELVSREKCTLVEKDIDTVLEFGVFQAEKQLQREKPSFLTNLLQVSTSVVGYLKKLTTSKERTVQGSILQNYDDEEEIMLQTGTKPSNNRTSNTEKGKIS